MNTEAPLYTAVVGCGPSGCLITSLLRQSSAKARLIAVDQSKEALDESKADIMMTAQPGGKVPGSIGTYELVFIVLDPSEPGSPGWAEEIAGKASDAGAYVFGIVIRPPGQAMPDLPDIRSMLGSTALIDADYIFQKRGKEPEMALQIAFNFTAHTLAFLAAAVDAGNPGVAELRKATEKKTIAFAASHMSEPLSIYSLTMSKINRAEVRSGIIFEDDAIEDVPARRIFYAIGRSLPKAELSMIRTKGLEPFKLLAILGY